MRLFKFSYDHSAALVPDLPESGKGLVAAEYPAGTTFTATPKWSNYKVTQIRLVASYLLPYWGTIGYYQVDIDVSAAQTGQAFVFALPDIPPPSNPSYSWYVVMSATTTAQPLPTYTITSSAGAGGGISPLGESTVTQGYDKSYTITPSVGYVIDDVLVDGVSVGAVSAYTFSNVTANHTIAASFRRLTYTITSAAGTGGSISPLGSTTVNHGDNQAYTITAAEGYEVSNVAVDGVNVGAVTTYTFSGVNANHAIAASFALVAATTYTVTSSCGPFGSIVPFGENVVSEGGSICFMIAPFANCSIFGVYVDDEDQGKISSYCFTNVQANHTIAASFIPNTGTHLIASSADVGGSISPSGDTIVPDGEDQSYVITPDMGYIIDDVFVDNVSVGPTANYTFSYVKEDHSISATFIEGVVDPPPPPPPPDDTALRRPIWQPEPLGKMYCHIAPLGV